MAFLVLEELERMATTHPAIAAGLLRKLVATDQHGWMIVGSEEHVRAILSAGLRSAEAAESTKQAIHELGARGHFQFRDLLSVEETGLAGNAPRS